jgi:hypothetical protein
MKVKVLFMTGLLFCLIVGFLNAQNAVIKDFVGTVEVKAAGAAAWAPARQGQTLAQNAMISTSFKSTATLTIGSSTLIVQPLTRLTLAEITASQGNEKVALGLQAGRVRADVKPPVGGNTEFTVRAPTATASVRGTSFDFDGVNLSVDEGRVQVAGGDGTSVYVAAGNQVVSDPETGRIQSPSEAFHESLSPASPAGVDNAGASAKNATGKLIIEADRW